MPTRIANQITIFCVLISFTLGQTLSFASPADSSAGIFEKVEGQFVQAKTTDALFGSVAEMLTTEDLHWLRTQPGYNELASRLQISRRGKVLNLAYAESAKNIMPIATITLLDQSTFTFLINGQQWQFRPYLSAQENIKQLEALLEKHPSTQRSNLNAWLSRFIPEANAAVVVPLVMAAGLYAAVSSAAAFICAGLVEAGVLSDPYIEKKQIKNGCYALPFLPIKWALDFGGRIFGKRSVPKIKSFSCEKRKHPAAQYEQYMTIALDNGSSIEAYTAAGHNEVNFALQASNGKPAVYRTLRADKNWNLIPSENQGMEKGLDKVAKQTLKTIPLLLDLCKNPAQLAKVNQRIRESTPAGLPITGLGSKSGDPKSATAH